MIKMFRIDERLIHGQIAIKWSRHTGVDHIVVGNDAAANSPIIQKSLKWPRRPALKPRIRGVDDDDRSVERPALREYENPDAGQQYPRMPSALSRLSAASRTSTSATMAGLLRNKGILPVEPMVPICMPTTRKLKISKKC